MAEGAIGVAVEDPSEVSDGANERAPGLRERRLLSGIRVCHDPIDATVPRQGVAQVDQEVFFAADDGQSPDALGSEEFGAWEIASKHIPAVVEVAEVLRLEVFVARSPGERLAARWAFPAAWALRLSAPP